jgi:hypothetical protein
MDEESVTKTLRDELVKSGFYVKKFADFATLGIPDCFIAKDKRGFFAEIKYIELERFPTEFKRWSILKSSSKMIQFTTMIQVDHYFLARYILIFRIAEKEVYYCLVMPSILFEHMRKDIPMKLPKLFQLKEFVQHIKQFLQLQE